MNIADIPSELFEYYIYKDLHPHCNLINQCIKFVDIVITTRNCILLNDNDIQIKIAYKLCFYNNRSLLVFYKYCSYLQLNEILYCVVCMRCIILNYLDTFKWAAKKYYLFNFVPFYHRITSGINLVVNDVCNYSIDHKKLIFMKWLFKNHNNETRFCLNNLKFYEIFIYVIKRNNISFIEWCNANNIILNIHKFDVKTYNNTYQGVTITTRMGIALLKN